MFPTNNIVQHYDANSTQQSAFAANPYNMIMPVQTQPPPTAGTTTTQPDSVSNGIQVVSEESSWEAKLALSERTCEIYRHQIRYMQDQMQNLRIIIQDKENVIDNLILRYDLGDIPAVEQTEDEQVESFDINVDELRKKAEALAQRTMLENFELREMLTDLRDENFQLRHEVFELSDRLNRTKLQLANVTQKAAIAAQDQSRMDYRSPQKTLPYNKQRTHKRDESNPTPDLGFDEDDLQSDEEDAVDDPHAVAKRQERERRESLSRKPPDLFEPAMTQEAVAKRAERAKIAHRRDSSVARPSNLLPLSDSSDDDDQSGTKRRGSVEENEHENTAEARSIRAERAAKHHKRDSSVAIPNIYGKDSDSDDDRPDKRRDSVSDPANTAEARRIRAERAAKHHKRDSSAAVPDLFGSVDDDAEYGGANRHSYIDPANTAEAQRIREDRAAKHHKRDSSLPTPPLFDENAMDIINKQSARGERANGKRDSIVTPNLFGDEDPAQTAEAIAIREAREQQRAQHERDESAVTPNMFADDFEDTLDNQRTSKKRGSFVTPNIYDEHPSHTAEAIEIREARAAKHHKRGSSIPTPNIFADNAEERLEIQAQRAAKRRESFTTPNLFADDAEDALQKRAERASKMNRKRDSIPTPDLFASDESQRLAAEAIAKRKEQERRVNAKRDSLMTPAMFENDPSMSSEAIRARLVKEAGAHYKKLSQVIMQDVFGPGIGSDDEEIAVKHARRQSREVLMRKAGDAGHFSDPEIESTNKRQRIDSVLRKKKRKAGKARKKRERERAAAKGADEAIAPELQQRLDDLARGESFSASNAALLSRSASLREPTSDDEFLAKKDLEIRHSTGPQKQPPDPNEIYARNMTPRSSVNFETKSREPSKSSMKASVRHRKKSSSHGRGVSWGLVRMAVTSEFAIGDDQALEESHHRRESTLPIPNNMFDDSDSDDEKFKSNVRLSIAEDKLKISALEIELERFVEKSNILQRELDAIKLGATVPSQGVNPLDDDYDPDEDLIMGATTTTDGGPDEMLGELQIALHDAVDSKMRLLQATSREINRLNHVVTVFMSVYNVKWNVIQNLVSEYEQKSGR